MGGLIRSGGRFMASSFFVAVIATWMICPAAMAESECEFRQSEISQPLIPNELARAVVNLEGIQIAQAVGSANELIQNPEPVLVQSVTEILQGQGRMVTPDEPAMQRSEDPVTVALSPSQALAGEAAPMAVMKHDALEGKAAGAFAGAENLFPAGAKHEMVQLVNVIPAAEATRAVIGQVSVQAVGVGARMMQSALNVSMQLEPRVDMPAPVLVQQSSSMQTVSSEQTHAGTTDFGGPCGGLIVESPSPVKEFSGEGKSDGGKEFASTPAGTFDLINPRTLDGGDMPNEPAPEISEPSFNVQDLPADDLTKDGVDLDFVEVPADVDPGKTEKVVEFSAEVDPAEFDLPVTEDGGSGGGLELGKDKKES